jgi:hypothetical protein
VPDAGVNRLLIIGSGAFWLARPQGVPLKPLAEKLSQIADDLSGSVIARLRLHDALGHAWGRMWSSRGTPGCAGSLSGIAAIALVERAIVGLLSDEVQQRSRGQREQRRGPLVAARETGLPAVWLAGPCRVDAD